MKKKMIAMICFLASMVALTIILAVAFRVYINRLQKETTDQSYDRYYVMISQDSKSDFWRSVYEGAFEKGKENNIYVELLGEKYGERFTRDDLMRIAISSMVDGIIVDADETEEMTALIDEAVSHNIPVVTLYNDSSKSMRCSFVGIGSYNLGVEYGRKVLEIVREGENVDVAILVNSDAKDTSQNIFCSAISDTISKNKNKVINLSLVSVDNKNAFSVEESIRDLFMEENLPDIIICLNEVTTTCLYQAVIDYNKVGQVNILGYYDSDIIINAIDTGVIEATASINTRQMGEYCIQALEEYYDYGNTSQYFIADIAFIHKLNVKKYMSERGIR